MLQKTVLFKFCFLSLWITVTVLVWPILPFLFMKQCTLCQWMALGHSSITYLKKPRDYPWPQVRSTGQIVFMLWDWPRKIQHLRNRCALTAVSLENLLLLTRSISYFYWKYICFQLCLTDIKPLYLYVTLTETTLFLLKMSLRSKTCITLVLQSKIRKGHHRSNHRVGRTVLFFSGFGVLVFVGLFGSTLFAPCTWTASKCKSIKVFSKGACRPHLLLRNILLEAFPVPATHCVLQTEPLNTSQQLQPSGVGSAGGTAVTASHSLSWQCCPSAH